MTDENGVDRSRDWTYKPKGKEIMLSGNLNPAVALGAVMYLSLLEKNLKEGYLTKSEKEEHLRQIRHIRKELGMPELPNYNSTEFSEKVAK